MSGFALLRGGVAKANLPCASGALVCSGGTLVLCGWVFGFDEKNAAGMLLLQMKANTALALLLLGLALIASKPRHVHFRRRASILCFVLPALSICLLALMEYSFVWTSGIDQFIATDNTTRSFPGRMSPLTALMLTLFSVSILLACGGHKRRIIASQWLGVVLLFVSTVILLAYLYDASALLKVGAYPPVAWNTALAGQLLALGLIAIHPDVGLMAPLSSRTLAAAMGRRLLLSVWIALPFLAWLRGQAQSRDLFGAEFGVALVVAMGLAMMSALVLWHTATAEAGERRIQYLNRVYSVLSEINSLIVRASDRTELLREASQIAVQRGGFPRAWFGMVDAAGQTVELVAHVDAAHVAGSGSGLLHERLSLRPGPAGYSLIGQAVHERAPVVCNDISAKVDNPFRAELLASGIRSLAILPIEIDGKVIGIFKLHAEIEHFFHAEEMRLLRELVGDIAFALRHLEQLRQLEHLAYFDAVTGLANARLFEERLQQMIDGGGGRSLAVIVFDLISFRLVNQAYGRQAGDEAMQVLARRLGFACGEGSVARLGSNLFGVLVHGTASEAGIVRAYQRIDTVCFGEEFMVHGQRLALAARAGIAILHADGNTPRTLLNNAESALRAARLSGALYRFHNAGSNERHVARLAMHAQLARALSDSEFMLHYQIKVDATTGQPCGAEALLRWHSAELGAVPPATFVPVLEEMGLIGKVGAWALHRAATDSKQVVAPLAPEFRIAVNVSALQLMEPDFVDKVKAACGDDASMAMLDLELTESLIMSDVEASIEKLRSLRALGVKIAIDDFGTGYSSMAYLARLPLDYLKIDRAFVTGLPENKDNAAVIASIIGLGHALGLRVVAEGIEHGAQADMLASLGCDQLQGYYFGRPEPLPDLLGRLSEHAAL